MTDQNSPSKDVLTETREAAHALGNDPPNGITTMRALLALHGAVAEIERLTLERDGWKKRADDLFHGDAGKDQREIERLRAALDDAADMFHECAVECAECDYGQGATARDAEGAVCEACAPIHEAERQARAALSGASSPTETIERPYCWVISGDDTAKANGWIDARVTSEGEFTKPLYERPAVESNAAAETHSPRSTAGLIFDGADDVTRPVKPILGTDKAISDEQLKMLIRMETESLYHRAFVELWERRGSPAGQRGELETEHCPENSAGSHLGSPQQGTRANEGSIPSGTASSPPSAAGARSAEPSMSAREGSEPATGGGGLCEHGIPRRFCTAVHPCREFQQDYDDGVPLVACAVCGCSRDQHALKALAPHD